MEFAVTKTFPDTSFHTGPTPKLHCHIGSSAAITKQFAIHNCV